MRGLKMGHNRAGDNRKKRLLRHRKLERRMEEKAIKEFMPEQHVCTEVCWPPVEKRITEGGKVVLVARPMMPWSVAGSLTDLHIGDINEEFV